MIMEASNTVAMNIMGKRKTAGVGLPFSIQLTSINISMYPS